MEGEEIHRVISGKCRDGRGRGKQHIFLDMSAAKIQARDQNLIHRTIIGVNLFH